MGGSNFNITILKNTLPVRNGGTGIDTYAVGDILYASATNTLSKLGIGSIGETLKISSGGLPEWGAGLADVTGETNIGTSATSDVGVGTTAHDLTLNSDNLRLNFTGNNLSLNGLKPDTAGQVIKYDGSNIIWPTGGNSTVDASEATGIGTNVTSDITLGKSSVGLNINCVSFNLNIGNTLAGDGQVLKYNSSLKSARWESLVAETLDNQLINVFTGNCSTSSSTTFTNSTLTFPTINNTTPTVEGINLNTGQLSGIGTHTITNNYKKSSSNVEKVIIEYDFCMYDKNITTKLETELWIKKGTDNIGLIQKSDILLKSLSGNQSKKISKKFIVDGDKFDTNNNNTIEIKFIDRSSTPNNIYLFTDNSTDTQGDSDVNISIKEIGTKNTTYGSSINSLPIGEGNPSSGKFTTLENTGVFTLGGHIIPSSNDSYDIGSAEKKIRDTYISDNSLWIGDEHKLGIDKTLNKANLGCRNINKIPTLINNVNSSTIFALDYINNTLHKNYSSISEFSISDWQSYAKYLNLNSDPGVLFGDSDDWEYNQIDSLPSYLYNSDDRIKINEELITNATQTLLKLRPQIYDKLKSLNSTESVKNAGLIAQEIYYEIPELRYIINIPEDATLIDNNIIANFEDIKNDPDYNNWGSTPASVDYISLIAYLVKGFQEQNSEITTLKTEVTTLESKPFIRITITVITNSNKYFN